MSQRALFTPRKPLLHLGIGYQYLALMNFGDLVVTSVIASDSDFNDIAMGVNVIVILINSALLFVVIFFKNLRGSKSDSFFKILSIVTGIGMLSLIFTSKRITEVQFSPSLKSSLQNQSFR